MHPKISFRSVLGISAPDDDVTMYRLNPCCLFGSGWVTWDRILSFCPSKSWFVLLENKKSGFIILDPFHFRIFVTSPQFRVSLTCRNMLNGNRKLWTYVQLRPRDQSKMWSRRSLLRRTSYTMERVFFRSMAKINPRSVVCADFWNAIRRLQPPPIYRHFVVNRFSTHGHS